MGFYVKNTPWIGSPYHKWGGRHDQDGSIYRIFGPDAIAFQISLAFLCGSRDDDTETVAFYYKIPGTEKPPISTPNEWWITGLYDGGAEPSIFEQSEPPENVPIHTWPNYYRSDQKFLRRVTANRGWIDWRFSGVAPEIQSGNFTGKSMYAGTLIGSADNKKTTLRLCYDDWISCWFNGKKLGTWKSEGTFETVNIPIEFNEGTNSLMLKSNNLGHHWNPWVSNIAFPDLPAMKP